MSRKDSRSKFLSLILRHKPEVANLTLNKEGYVLVEELLTQFQKKDIYFTREVLEDIVLTDKKGRYAFSEDGLMIRANQGHSLREVEVDLDIVYPEKSLYHGTSERFLGSIFEKGILKGTRLYVHLTESIDTAIETGKRHGKPVVIQIDIETMQKDGFVFKKSKNNVYLTDNIPVKYLKLVK